MVCSVVALVGQMAWRFVMSVERSDVRLLVDKYFWSWQDRDWNALRECLAADIHFDWGVETYTSPDEFIAAADAGIEWTDVRLLASVLAPDAAAIVYEGVNVTDRVRLRTAEYLTIEDGRIRTAIAVFAVLSG